MQCVMSHAMPRRWRESLLRPSGKKQAAVFESVSSISPGVPVLPVCLKAVMPASHSPLPSLLFIFLPRRRKESFSSSSP